MDSKRHLGIQIGTINLNQGHGKRKNKMRLNMTKWWNLEPIYNPPSLVRNPYCQKKGEMSLF